MSPLHFRRCILRELVVGASLPYEFMPTHASDTPPWDKSTRFSVYRGMLWEKEAAND